MNRWKLLSNLRIRFVLLALLGVLPALALLLYSASEQRDQAITAAQDEALRFVRLAAADQERLIESSRQLLAVVARFPELRVADTGECERLLSDLTRDYPVYANIGVIEPDGALRCSALPSADEVDLSDRAYFQRAIESQAFAVGDFQIGRVTNLATINVAYPVLDAEGSVIEIIYAALDLAELNSFVAEAQLPEDSFLLVLDLNGTVLVRHPEPETWVGESIRGTPVVESILQGETGFAESADSNGREHIFVSTPLLGGPASTSAYIVLAQPKEIVLERANRAFNRNLGRLGVVGILAVVAAWVGGDVLARKGPENRKALVRRLYDAFNTGNVDGLDEVLTRDFIDHDPVPGQSPGVDGMRRLILQFRVAFPDGTLVADELVADAETVIARVTLTGTQMEEFFGVQPIGRRVQATGIETFRVAGGKITESWSVFSAMQPMTETSEVTPFADKFGGRHADEDSWSPKTSGE